jgi:hypothetical protein
MKTHPNAKGFPASLPLDDPELMKAVEEALEPLKKIFPAKMLKVFRREMIVQLAADTEAIALVRNIHRKGVAKSTELLVSTPTDGETSRPPSRPASGGSTGTPQ